MSTRKVEMKHVKMAEAKVVQGSDTLTAEGVGSCVAVCLMDKENEIMGMAHVVLPTDRGDSEKYADTLLSELIHKLKAEGADKENLEAKIFGGSTIFDFSSGIGEKNIKSAKDFLEEENIPVVSEDTGGDKGRSIKAYSDSGNVEVKKSFESKKVY